MKINTLYKFTISSLIMLIIISAVTLYNLRNTTIKAAIINAENFAEVVKDGLTTYMVNGQYEKSNLFLSNILDNDNINSINIIRNQNLHDQYGFRSDRVAKTELEKSVLSTGKTQYKITEDLVSSYLEISVPLKYDPTKNVDCVSCHNINNDTVLGALTIQMNISELKILGLEAFYLVPIIILIGIFYLSFLFRRTTSSYENSFKLLENNVKKNIEGRFEPLKSKESLPEDIDHFVEEYNKLILNIKQTTEDIDFKLKGFVGDSSMKSKSNITLDETKIVISNLSILYQFKKEIEFDNSLEEIYKRLSEILENLFNVKNFAILETNKENEKTELIKSVGKEPFCLKHIKNKPEDCRCSRVSKDIHTIDYQNTCAFSNTKDKYFYCININISTNKDLIFTFSLDSKEELGNLKQDIMFVKSFINEAIPAIKVKILMQALKDSAFRDSLTGLYNRTFLDENSKKLISQVKRENKDIAVLLLDMDHFKAVNDEYGHDIGDKVLKELSRILNENIKESDIAIRYGGEEFMVLLVGVKSKDYAHEVANKIRLKVKENEIDVYAGTKLKKTISIGLAMFPENGNSLDTVIKNADIALYEAKNSGRDSVVIFEESQISSIDLF